MLARRARTCFSSPCSTSRNGPAPLSARAAVSVCCSSAATAIEALARLRSLLASARLVARAERPARICGGISAWRAAAPTTAAEAMTSSHAHGRARLSRHGRRGLAVGAGMNDGDPVVAGEVGLERRLECLAPRAGLEHRRPDPPWRQRSRHRSSTPGSAAARVPKHLCRPVSSPLRRLRRRPSAARPARRRGQIRRVAPGARTRPCAATAGSRRRARRAARGPKAPCACRLEAGDVGVRTPRAGITRLSRPFSIQARLAAALRMAAAISHPGHGWRRRRIW